MNFYSHHIGDYRSATAHLTFEEDAAYRRLMDIYYMTERPLPLDRRRLHTLTLCQTASNRRAVDAVLAEFFIESSSGFIHKRCESEIKKASEKRAKARGSASSRWTNDLNLQETDHANASKMECERIPSDALSDNKMECVGNAPNPNPNPSKEDGIGTRARDLETDLREAAGWQNEPAPNLAVTGAGQALIDAGADLHLDVLPTVRAIAPQARGRTTWKYFLGAIAQARDDRIAAAQIVSPPNSQRPPHARRQTQDEQLADIVNHLGSRPVRSGTDFG